MPRRAFPARGARQAWLSSPRDDRDEGLSRRRDPLAFAAREARPSSLVRQGGLPPRLRAAARRDRDPQSLHPGRRRHSGPRRERQVRAQAFLPARADALVERPGQAAQADPRRRLERGAARDRRVVAQAAARRGQSHADRGAAAQRPAEGARLGRRRAPFRAGRTEAVLVVELSRARLAAFRPRPPPRPCVGDARPRRALEGRRRAQGRARLVARVRPRAAPTC